MLRASGVSLRDACEPWGAFPIFGAEAPHSSGSFKQRTDSFKGSRSAPRSQPPFSNSVLDERMFTGLICCGPTLFGWPTYFRNPSTRFGYPTFVQSGRMPPNDLLLPSVTYHPHEDGSGDAPISTPNGSSTTPTLPTQEPLPGPGASTAGLDPLSLPATCMRRLAPETGLPPLAYRRLPASLHRDLYRASPPRLAGVTQHASCI